MNSSARIADRLRNDIISGRLLPGCQMRSRRELQAQLAGSSNAIQAALDELVEEGFIKVHSRHGTFVAHHPPHRFRYGLVLPSLPHASGKFSSNYLNALCAAAKRLRFGGRRMTLHVACSQDPDLPQHTRLRQCIARGSLAGLFLLDYQVADHWLSLESSSFPIAITESSMTGPGLTKVVLDQRLWFDAALDAVVARGLRSLAVLVVADSNAATMMAYIQAGSLRRGLRCRPWWVTAVDERWPEWAFNVALGLCDRNQNETPDALLIADDNFVPAATRGVAASGVLSVRSLTVIGHGNLPSLTPSAVPILRLCWDCEALLERCVIRMEEHRANGVPSPAETLPTRMLDLTEDAVSATQPR